MDIQKTYANRVILEPGDRTRYDFVFSQTSEQMGHGVIGIALYMGKTGCAFTYSVDAINWAWKQMENLEHNEQLKHEQVGIMSEFVYSNNPWTARATIEAAFRWLHWRHE